MREVLLFLLLQLLRPNGTDEYMGISRHFSNGLNISEMKYIALNIKADTSVSSETVNVLFRVVSDEAEIAAVYMRDLQK